jgi:hypothetical protein
MCCLVGRDSRNLVAAAICVRAKHLSFAGVLVGWQLFFLISSRLAAGPAESRSDVSAREDGAAKSRSGVFAREGGAAGDPGMDSLQRFIEN